MQKNTLKTRKSWLFQILTCHWAARRN